MCWMRRSFTPSTSRGTDSSPRSRKRVMVFGTFALLHAGHRHVIRTAMRLGSLTIIVARNTSVNRIKGRFPVEDEQVRLRALKNAFPSAQVLLGDKSDFLSPVRHLAPDIIVLGYDQRLPPGVTIDDLPGTVIRATALEPHKYKSSLLAGGHRKRRSS